MQVSSSGESIVFDSKTQKAIDEGKNRVTMLSAETVRLHDLKVDLEGQIVRLNNEIVEKTAIQNELKKDIESATKQKQTLVDEVNELIRQRDILKEESKEEKAKLAESISIVEERKQSLEKRETELNKKESDLVKKETNLKVNADTVDKKMQAIKDLLSKL